MRFVELTMRFTAAKDMDTNNNRRHNKATITGPLVLLHHSQATVMSVSSHTLIYHIPYTLG